MLPSSRRLEPGEEANVVFRVALLAEGRLELRVGVEEVRMGRRVRRGKGKGKKGEEEEEEEGEGEKGVWFSEVLEVKVGGE